MVLLNDQFAINWPDIHLHHHLIQKIIMKNCNSKTLLTLLMTSCLILWSACQKENVEPEHLTDSEILNSRNPANVALYTLDLNKFATGIENAFNGKVSGLGYTIFHNGSIYYKGTGGLGWLRRPVDAPQREHSAQQRQGLASTTKYATAILVAKILERNGKTLDEKIYKYLPSNWNPDVNFKNLSFRQLLAHKAGLIKYGNKYAHVKKTVEGGINNIQVTFGTRVYDNINFFLPHYLVAYMIGKLENPYLLNQLKIAEKDTVALKNLLASNFRSYLRSYVFKPSGLTYWDKVDFQPWDNYGPIPFTQGCKYYETSNINEKGSDPNQKFYESGPGGLYISPVEYAQMINATAQGKIISKSLYNTMKLELLGFDWALSGKFGPYYAKNGSARSEEMLIDFGNTQVIVISNCSYSNLAESPSLITNAFDAAAK